VRGWANLIVANCLDAVRDFNQVLTGTPDDAEALRGRAWALVHLGDYDQAIADLDRLQEMTSHP
jgi:Flp pilus assembly protein TadD